ncbi:MAG TPA: molybdopterin-dependent oxidoreductase [Chthoniobacterales bacterium]|nr:molybdopterin-dependent oxidoreductase [Chthoniobacterales bacterium]
MKTSIAAVNEAGFSRWKAAGSGALAGTLAGVVMTAIMLLLAQMFGVATPLAVMGDRLSVFIPADQFLALMGRVGGYNHMKQLGVGSVMAAQILLGALGGIVYGLVVREAANKRRPLFAVGVFILLPLLAVTAVLWPVLGTHYGGLPIQLASIVTFLGLLVSFVVFERTLVLTFAGLTGRSRSIPAEAEFTPPIGRRALIVGGLGLLVVGGGAGLLRKLYRAASFSYDGTQYKGPGVEAITPNDKFYCVTKNVIDPKVNESIWRLEVLGLVQTRQRYRIGRLRSLPSVTQETTLMCISNGLDAGLMSNAVWKGVPMRVLLEAAGPLPAARKVRLHGVDNYTDTISLEKALDPATLVVYEMNGERLPDRHGFPARVIVPGYFGEKHVKWITRLELAGAEAEGFYEKQGWGPDFTVPIRTRVDQPAHDDWIGLAQLRAPVLVKGIAYGGDRGISRVEITSDDGATWTDAKLDYPGTRLSWSLWSHEWRPTQPGDHVFWARATNGDGKVQSWDPERPFKSGTSGFHKIVVHVFA